MALQRSDPHLRKRRIVEVRAPAKAAPVAAAVGKGSDGDCASQSETAAAFSDGCSIPGRLGCIPTACCSRRGFVDSSRVIKPEAGVLAAAAAASPTSFRPVQPATTAGGPPADGCREGLRRREVGCNNCGCCTTDQ
ncbi:hypothetical protein Vretifemale_13705 [Volvox reticuliferus]|uniref:Uncharacterized protein n=1 Tax=Volvox reticuliferus TaxID=1737510 RepID=A0A8J4CR80_9CHLO|nr:hypothetical protein Vretifemale_13705 [Volvox reticuliferus]